MELLINSFFDKIKITNIINNKSKFLIFFLLIIKVFYGRTLIFDILCTLYTVIVLGYITTDIDNGNNITENKSTIKYSLIGLIVYFISKNSMINKNINLTSFLSKTLIGIINTFTKTPQPMTNN